MKDFGASLEAAFDREGIAEGDRQPARTVFDSVIRSERNVDVALTAALDKVARNGGSFQLMEAAFWTAQDKRDKSPLGRVVNAFENLKAKVGLNGPTLIH